MDRRKATIKIVLLVISLSLFVLVNLERSWLASFLSGALPQATSLSTKGQLEAIGVAGLSSSACPCWNVVWLVPKEWEVFYIDDILADLPLCHPAKKPKFRWPLQTTLDVWSPQVPLLNQTVLVLRFYQDDRVYGLLQQAVQILKRNGFKFTIFLLSDEKHPEDVSCGLERVSWMVEQSDLLLRQYWTHDCASKDNVLVVPLLVTTQAHDGLAAHCTVDGAKLSEVSASERTNWMYFSSGHELPARTALANALRRFASNQTADDRLGRAIVVNYPRLAARDANAFAHRLSTSRYAAIVQGNSEDTYRFAEALLCGSVPWMEQRVHDYYRHWLPWDLLDLIQYYEPDNIETSLQALWFESDEDYAQRRQRLLHRASRWFKDTRREVARRVYAATCG